MSKPEESDWGQAPQEQAEEVDWGTAPDLAVAAGAVAPFPSTVWAVVGADGTLIRGVWTIGASKLNFGNGLGRYRVSFWPVVTTAAYVATIGRWEAFQSTPPGSITVNLLDDHSVFVVTRDENWTYADRPFHLAVHLA